MFFFRKKKTEILENKIKRPKPVVLLILDGWGITQAHSGNAITQASTPVFDDLVKRYPATTLNASGEAVGLPWGKAGNSEVGHLNLGLGRIVFQVLPRINCSISDGSFFSNMVFLSAIKNVTDNKGNLHVMGLVSNGGVHSSMEHLKSLLVLARNNHVKEVYIHCFLDGRDTPRNSARAYIKDLQRTIKENKIGKIATMSGRFYAMDRDNHWDRIEKVFKAMTTGEATQATDPILAIEESYAKKIYDEEFVPTVITENGLPVATVKDGDSLIFFNFRPDRARQITKAFSLPGFEKFERGAFMRKLHFVCMTEYERSIPVDVAFPPEVITNSLGETLASKGLKQLRIAETEKYAHVTYFFNGGGEKKSEGEVHQLVPSPPVDSYDQKPEMSAPGVTEKVVKAVNDELYDFILINYANADMVGHSGNLLATEKAVETLDRCLGKVVNAVLAKNGIVLITADHGNAEMKHNLQTGQMSKEHTTNPVPFIIVSSQYEGKKIGWQDALNGDLSLIKPRGILSDVAPTILKLLDIEKPYEMTGKSLL
ncbi:MAG: 2,3-bisphosphoglycerate-independent phosphoglycerate mutase [bacterium]